jgi:pimeloyl-CoA synthetase
MKMKIRMVSGREIIIENKTVNSINEFILKNLNNERGKIDFMSTNKDNEANKEFIQVSNIETLEEIK